MMTSSGGSSSSSSPPPEPQEENVEARDLCESRQNPLLNNVIVEQLFKVTPFDFKDFKNFRLVCKLWWEQSLPGWRQNAWLNLKDDPLYFGGPLPPPSALKQYSAMLGKSGDPYHLLGKNHFKKYHIEDWQWDYNSYPVKLKKKKNKLENLSSVWKFVTHLRCSGSVFIEWKDLHDIMFRLTPNLVFLSLQRNEYICTHPQCTADEENSRILPKWTEEFRPSPSEIRGNLRELEVSLGSIRGENFPLSWLEVFARYPNLRTLKLQNFSGEYPDHPYRQSRRKLQCLQVVREKCGQHYLADLQHLDLVNLGLRPVGKPTFLSNDLELLKFPLQSLSFDVGTDSNEPLFRKILETHFDTLQTLIAYRGHYSSVRSFMAFPFNVQLFCLTELKLIGPICQNLHFLKDTPNLRVLVLVNGKSEMKTSKPILETFSDFSLSFVHKKVYESKKSRKEASIIASTNFYGSEMTNLVLPHMEVFMVDQELCGSNKIVLLAELFPNLKILRLGLNNIAFQMVCSLWKELEHLDIHPVSIDENGFLGIVDCQKYKQSNITDLKHLKSIRMGPNASKHSIDGALTDDSILFGLLALPALNGVSLTVAPKASRETWGKLTAKFPLLESPFSN